MTTSRALSTGQSQENIGGAVSPFVAGKNKIINGDFNIWQRGTSFSTPADGSYTADRFITYQNGTGPTRTISQQAFTPGTAPVAGYESAYFFRYLCSNLGSGNSYQAIQNRVEDVRTFAGQTATFSFWAKADSAKTITVSIQQNFGSGGSSAVSVTYTAITLSTSWARYSVTMSVPSISGQTIGSSSFFQVGFELGSQTITLDTWGWQLEAGSTATPFTTATGTIQGELTLAQRYYVRYSIPGSYTDSIMGIQWDTGSARFVLYLPATMRAFPSVSQTNLAVSDIMTFNSSITGFGTGTSGVIDYKYLHLYATFSSVGAAWRAVFIRTEGSAGYFELNSEL
jgi:hypothetical protein